MLKHLFQSQKPSWSHTTPPHLLPFFLNMRTRELSVNEWENKVTSVTCLKK